MGVLEEELASEEEAFAHAATAPQSACPDGSCGCLTESAGSTERSHEVSSPQTSLSGSRR
jgi:hypothetical protein